MAIVYRPSQALTITLASLANGSARQSDLVAVGKDKLNRFVDGGALVFVKLTSGGSAPTASTLYEIYLLRHDGTFGDDNAGLSDAAITIENAPLLGTIVVTATASKSFYGVFDTGPLGPLGTLFGIAIRNSTGQAMNATESNHAIRAMFYAEGT